jgi:hypothetical protein
VLASVAAIAQGDQVFLRIIAKSASPLNVVNFKIAQRPTSLAAPSVALQHSLSQCWIRFPIESKARPFLPNGNRHFSFPFKYSLFGLCWLSLKWNEGAFR